MGKLQDRVVLVGVGGATCSGKTTLAKHLLSILPNSFIIHQDVRALLSNLGIHIDQELVQDFAPPEHLIPIHPVHKVQDWDTPQGAIDWPRLRAFLRNVKESGAIPPGHKSHDHLNEQKKVPLTDSAYQTFRTKFQMIEDEQRKKGIRIIWGLVDGFLLYWDKGTWDQLDVRFFLRVPHDTLKERRQQRFGYHTAEGSLWQDPPEYWEHIVYPAYTQAHKNMFENGDVEHGKLTGERVPNLVVIEPAKEGAGMTIDDIVRVCSDVLWDCAGRLNG